VRKGAGASKAVGCRGGIGPEIVGHGAWRVRVGGAGGGGARSAGAGYGIGL